MNAFFVLFGIFLTSCSTSQKVSFKSFPEGASVLVENSRGEVKNLGVTPLEINRSDIFDSQSRMGQAVVSKEGHESQKIFVAADEREVLEVTVKLRPIAFDNKSEKLKDRQEQLAKSLAKISHLITTKKYDEGERLLQQFVSDFPYISVAYDYLGNIAYLRRDFKSAVQFYKKSLNINPDNIETRQMVDRLTSMVN